MDEIMIQNEAMGGVFARNLQFLRKQKELSQEALAEQMNVSRQSVSKWESGGAWPEMNTLLALCELFGTDLDTLLRGDTQRARAQDEAGYDAHMNQFARAITGGVVLVLLGVCAFISFEGLRLYMIWPSQVSSVGVALLLLFVLAATVIFMVYGMRHDAFLKKHPHVESFYTQEQVEAFNHKFVWLMAGPVAAILGAVVVLVTVAPLLEMRGLGLSYQVWLLTGFLLVLTAAVAVLVWGGMQKSKYALEEGDDDSYLPPAARRLKSALCSATMVVAAAVYVVTGLASDAWAVMWWVFVLGGFICAIIGIIFEAIYKKSQP